MEDKSMKIWLVAQDGNIEEGVDEDDTCKIVRAFTFDNAVELAESCFLSEWQDGKASTVILLGIDLGTEPEERVMYSFIYPAFNVGRAELWHRGGLVDDPEKWYHETELWNKDGSRKEN